ncbi:MAG: YceI family protein [Crocinitomicaceae bacterium]|nr:YceI family protein [Flavobacteriales bacterium]NQZ34813.1 YceI family protein [Crocinitomicaceae bacterium]
MKKFGILFLGAGALSLAACTASVDEETEVAVESVTYSLDAENSTLTWGASISPEYGHKGTISFKSGSITMEGDALTAGSFVVDMATIKNTDIEDEGKASYLEGHLTGTIVDEDHPVDMFFNIEKFPTVDVKLGEYKDGSLSTTLTILGSELTQDVPVTFTSDENGASIKGTFSMDFASLGIPGLDQHGEGSISTTIEFDLNVMLTK